MTDRETAEIPAERRDPTLPLPREGSAPARPQWWRRGPDRGAPLWVVGLILLAVAGSGFWAGWAARGEPRRLPQPPPREAQLPTADAVFCGRALDVAARVIQVYREALENRTAFTEAMLEDDEERLARLDAELPALTLRADRLQGRVTRALATCPS